MHPRQVLDWFMRVPLFIMLSAVWMRDFHAPLLTLASKILNAVPLKMAKMLPLHTMPL
jgi:hypothetical protein